MSISIAEEMRRVVGADRKKPSAAIKVPLTE